MDQHILDLRPVAEIDIDYTGRRAREVVGFALLFMVGVGLALAYNIWLDSGCHVNGVMTMAGKVCL